MTGNEKEKLPLLRTWKQEASGTTSPAATALYACAEELILAMLDCVVDLTYNATACIARTQFNR